MLSDEQKFKLASAWYYDAEDWEIKKAIAVIEEAESAATAPLLARIAELDRSLDVMAQNTESQAHASLQREIELTEKVEKLTQQLAEARKDAERYRWLRNTPLANNVTLASYFGGSRMQDFDAAIDAARAAIKEQT